MGSKVCKGVKFTTGDSGRIYLEVDAKRSGLYGMVIFVPGRILASVGQLLSSDTKKDSGAEDIELTTYHG